MTSRRITEEDKIALDHARHLAENGVPVFIAKQARTPEGDWDRHGGSGGTGYHLPTGWHEEEADPDVLDDWEPGWAVAAVMGHTVDGVDVDPQKGGGDSLAQMQAEGLVPRSYGRQRTPSGGTHDLIATLGVRSRDGFMPGVDVKAGDIGAQGRGFLFIAPTEKLSKVTGQVERYEWETPPDLTELALVGGDDSGAALAAAMLAERSLKSSSASVSAVGEDRAYDELPSDLQELARRKVEVVRDSFARRLADAEDWPEGQTDDKGRGWEKLASDAAYPLAYLGWVRWCSLTMDEAEAIYDELLPDAIAADPKCAGKFSGKVRAVQRPGARQIPPPWLDPEWSTAEDDFNAAGDEPSGKGKRIPLTVQLRQRVEAGYDVFPANGDGRIFVQPKVGGRAELLGGGFVMRATNGIGKTASTLSAAATEAAKVLAALAEAHTPRELALRVHYQPGRIVLDLAQRGNTLCAVVTPDGWTVEEVPPAGVAFQSSGRALPEPEPGGDVDELRRLLRWDEDDVRWPLVKGWLPAALIADKPRPMLGFFGPQGSAKTTTGRFVVGVLDPKPDGVLGGGFGKNGADDETKALTSYLPAWDNVSGLSGDGADRLSRLVTGDMIEKRRLYTDAEVVTIQFRRTGILTGVTVPRGVKPDTLDRLILVPVEPIPGERVAEGTLDAEWERVQPGVLGGVLDLASRMLAGLEAGRGRNPNGLRMADYAEALWAIDPELYKAYAVNVGSARADMAEDDPFIQTLLEGLRWWRENEDGPYEATADNARTEFEQWVHFGQWWPPSGRSFSAELTRTTELLRVVGVTVTERRSHGRRLKLFTFAPPDEDYSDLI